jgi:hypothetical protein
LTLIILVCQL